MGDLAVKNIRQEGQQNKFIRTLLNDIKALDYLLANHHFDNDIQRIGAEQELSLTTVDGLPLSKGPEILDLIDDSHVTTEIGRFNLEINLDPFDIGPTALNRLEAQLIDLLELVRVRACNYGGRIFLGGILPTLDTPHLTFDHITPEKRYFALSKRLHQMRGNDFEIKIEGTDELCVQLDSVLFEACNTSFQLHLQIPSYRFVDQYNWAQWIAAPVLGMSANSPHLLQKELWMETRIALFQQSIDTRTPFNTLRYRQPRVSFGQDWIQHSPSEIFKEQLARFPVIIIKDIQEDALEQVRLGKTPKLKALRTHNGTVYSWNRACYGISSNGLPHLRIEARYIPSGPTPIDAMANFAFWLGLQKAGEKYGQSLKERVPFKDAKHNFLRAAKAGLSAQLKWGNKETPLNTLVLKKLLPMAKEGLQTLNIASASINKYLQIMEGRAITGTNGAVWQCRNFNILSKRWNTAIATQELTKAIMDRQVDNLPVHEWDDLTCPVVIPVDLKIDTVSRWMTKDVFTVHESDPLIMIKSIMDWKNIRHIPVEDSHGELVGLISKKTWEKVHNEDDQWQERTVKEVMVDQLIIADEDLSIQEADKLMKTHQIGCLPVVRHQKLLGIITDTDLAKIHALSI